MTAYELRISDWSADVFSSDLHAPRRLSARRTGVAYRRHDRARARDAAAGQLGRRTRKPAIGLAPASGAGGVAAAGLHARMVRLCRRFPGLRSEERRVGEEWVSTC